MTKGTLFLTYEPNDLKLVRLSFTFDVLGIRKRSKLNLYKRPISLTVHTVHKPGAGAQAGAIPAQQQGPACSSMVWDVTPQDEVGETPPQLALQHSHSEALAAQ